MKCVGLTDDPKVSRKRHGDPLDWWQTPFRSEGDARTWKGDMLTVPGYQSGPDANGWRYGYTFTVRSRR